MADHDPATTPNEATLDADMGEVADAIAPGVMLGGRYRVEAFLAQGGMGEVYRAHDTLLGELVALKTIRAHLAGDPGVVERFRREIQLSRKVTHPNVCRIFDVFQHVSGETVTPILSMELLDGETLASRIVREGRMPLVRALPIVNQIVAALAAAHDAGVVHRDLKPGNVILCAGRRGGERAVVTDFGLAHLFDEDDPDGGGLLGTPAYIAPEQLQGTRFTPATDLYALGVVMYQILTGALPFVGDTPASTAHMRLNTRPISPRQRAPELGRNEEAVILRCLALRPEDRFQSADAIAHALAAPRRRRYIAAGIALAAATIAGSAVVARSTARAPWQPALRDLGPAYDENGTTVGLSPDGTLLAYDSDREQSGTTRVYIEKLSGGGPARAITAPELMAFYPRWARNGAGVYVVSAGGGAYYVPIDGGAPTQVGEGSQWPAECGEHELLWSVDGVDAVEAGGRRHLLKGPTSIPICDAAGRTVLFTRPADPTGDIYLAAYDGSGERRLTENGQWYMILAIHPDGRSVLGTRATEGANGGLWDIPVSGEAPRLLASGPGSPISPSVTADGRAVIFNQDLTSSVLTSLDLASGARRRLLNRVTGSIFTLLMPADASRLVSQRGKDMISMSLATGDERVLHEGRLLALTADGGEALYVSEAARDLLLAIPTAGGPPREVARLPGPIRTVVADREGAIHASVQAAAGREAWRIPKAGAPEREAPPGIGLVVPAPKSGWRAACAEMSDIVPTCALRVVAPGAELTDAGAPTIPGVGMLYASPLWTPDGESFVYHDGRAFRRRHVSGQDEVLAELPGAILAGFDLSRDGKTLYFQEVRGAIRRRILTNYGDLPRP